jgi:phospholipase/lecithinase/hemolysin
VHAPLRRLALGLAALAASAFIAGCGSEDVSTTVNKPVLKRLVTIGDSLSDVGTYQVGAIAAVGGGKFTVNPGPVWTETVAKALGYEISPGMQGFDGKYTLCPKPPNCTGWAMGGGRVTLHPGIRENPDGTGALAKTTKEQIEFHLARFGRFEETDLINVQGGGNDAFYQLGVFAASVGGGVPVDQASKAAVTALGTAGAEMAAYVKSMILANGGVYVTVQTLPDMALTPYGISLGPQTQALITAMTEAFNGQLRAGLAGSSAKLLDLDFHWKNWNTNPSRYGIASLAPYSCDKAKMAAITGGLVQDGNVLFCSTGTLIAGDTSRWFFADDVHPSQYGHKLFADLYLQELVALGWR